MRCAWPCRLLAALAARGLAAREVIEVHVHLAALVDRRRRVLAEAAADGVGDDAKALAELIDETEGELTVAHGRADEEDPRHLQHAKEHRSH